MKTFFELHVMGGWLFMTVLFIILVAVIVLSVIGLILAYGKQGPDTVRLKNVALTVKFLGGFAAVWGILGQGIGIYQACVAIQEIQDVSPALLAGGFQVSMIAPLYGIMIFLLSHILWFILKKRLNTLSSKQ
jgi:hypothetical protein